MNADYRPTLGSFFCVFQPRMVALLSVPATQGPPEEMDFELHKLHIAVFPLRVNLRTTFERSVNFRMNLWSHRFSQNTNEKLSRFLPSLHRAEILTIFCSYFGRNDDFINSFWNWLTFNNTVFYLHCCYQKKITTLKNIHLYFCPYFWKISQIHDKSCLIVIKRNLLKMIKL